MVNRELIEVFSEIAREKNVERSELASILEELFLYIIEREYGDSSNCSCIVNLDKGEIEIYAEKTIVEEIDDYKVEITLEEAIATEPEEAEGLTVGDVFVEVIDLRVFGRRIISTAKHFFSQKLRDVERNYIYEDYANRIGEIVIGFILDLSNLLTFFVIKSSNNLDLLSENCSGEFCKLFLVDGIESSDLDDFGNNSSKLFICSEWIFNCISAYATCANIDDILDELYASCVILFAILIAIAVLIAFSAWITDKSAEKTHCLAILQAFSIAQSLLWAVLIYLSKSNELITKLVLFLYFKFVFLNVHISIGKLWRCII